MTPVFADSFYYFALVNPATKDAGAGKLGSLPPR
jgi:hypothetical protein